MKRACSRKSGGGLRRSYFPGVRSALLAQRIQAAIGIMFMALSLGLASALAENSNGSADQSKNVDQIKSPTSFDPDQFALSGCNDTLLRYVKSKSITPKTEKWDEDTVAYKYEAGDALVLAPEDAKNDSDKFVIFFSSVTNLNAFDFTRRFYGKTLSELEDFFKPYQSDAVGVTINKNMKSITLSTEGADIAFYSNKNGANRIDFDCAGHD